MEPSDLVNMALREAGIPKRIGNIYEGSEAAKTALELYGQTRDELQREKDWQFTRRVKALVLLKGPPPDGGYSTMLPWSNNYPMPGFLYEYAYPPNCLDIRAINSAPSGPMPDLDPLPAVWRIDNDPTPVLTGTPPDATASGPPAKVILCNTTNAIATFRGQSTDPSLWDPGFIAAFLESLGKKFAKAFGVGPDQQKLDEAVSATTTQVASEIRG